MKCQKEGGGGEKGRKETMTIIDKGQKRGAKNLAQDLQIHVEESVQRVMGSNITRMVIIIQE